jgi:hypothetical protein
MIPVFEWAKTFHALDHAATVIGGGVSSVHKTIFRVTSIHYTQHKVSRKGAARHSVVKLIY